MKSCTLSLVLERVNKTSEGFYVTPFMSGGGLYEKFSITAEVISCPLGPFEDKCKFSETCTTANRYPSTWYPGPSSGKFFIAFKLSPN